MMLLVLELDVGGPWKMVRVDPGNYLNEMYTPLRTRCLMFNDSDDYKISEKIRPGYMYYLLIPGYISDYEVGRTIYKSWGGDAIWKLIERMNEAEGHTGLKWKGNALFSQEKYRAPPPHQRHKFDDRTSVY